jgi:hypothetical protein
MKGYRKISYGDIEVTTDEVNGEDLNDNLIKEVNHAVTSPILDHAEKTNILEYRVVVYVKRRE